jgi:hypothetical protein
MQSARSGQKLIVADRHDHASDRRMARGGPVRKHSAAITVNDGGQHEVVTDRRLIFLPQTFFGGPGTGVLGEVPREHVTLAEAKFGIVSLLRLAFGDAGDGISLNFPRVDKKNAEALAAAFAPVSAA